jgi:hypothetical protein
VKERDRWGVTNREVKDVLQEADIVKCIKSLRLRLYGHVERTQDQRMLKQIATAIMEEGKEEDHVKDGKKFKNI